MKLMHEYSKTIGIGIKIENSPFEINFFKSEA